MILPHAFNEDMHLYQTPGRYVLSTSDIIDLNGLSDYSRIPIATLRAACFRGKSLHKAVEEYELGRDWQFRLPVEFHEDMDGWFNFRDRYDFNVVGVPETRYVYLQGAHEIAVGGTIDLRFVYKDCLWICDLKTIHPLYGKALRFKKLAWRLQLESYKTATEMDEQFLCSVGRFSCIRKCIVHIHPKLKPHGFVFHEFEEDDSSLWDSCAVLAMEKVAVGILPSRRDVSVQAALEASMAHEEASV